MNGVFAWMKSNLFCIYKHWIDDVGDSLGHKPE